KMGLQGGERKAENTTLLVPATKRPTTSRYLDMSLVSDQAAEPRTVKKLGARIEQRKKLLLRRRYLVDLMLALALVGIALMVVENELYYVNIAAVTSMTTWMLLIVELLVCAVHPFPGDVQVYMTSISGVEDRSHIDGILSVLMMFRLYLVGRFLVAHSPLLTDPTTQTIAAVSHVKIDMFFVFKAAMTDHPGKVIALTMLSMYSVSVWAMRTCELYYTKISDAQSLTQSMWLAAITFLTVGYGDLTPMTHCGRFIAVVTGLMGLGSTALLVAVVAKKMEQTRTDKYVFNYLSMLHIENKRKQAAADVIKLSIKVYIWKKTHEREPKKVHKINLTYYSWRLSNAIRAMRSTRAKRQRFEEASVGLAELSQQVSYLQAITSVLVSGQSQVMDKLSDIQQHVRQKENDGGVVK
ncbi:unnamed protein product, partial [Candidula unifasciata]